MTLDNHGRMGVRLRRWHLYIATSYDARLLLADKELGDDTERRTGNNKSTVVLRLYFLQMLHCRFWIVVLMEINQGILTLMIL